MSPERRGLGGARFAFACGLFGSFLVELGEGELELDVGDAFALRGAEDLH